MSDLPIEGNLVIPAAELSLQFSRSGGPGGQHVNTAETRAQLRFDLAGSQVLLPGVKRRIQERYPSLMTSDGQLLIAADRQRSRQQNVEDARQRLADIVRSCLHPPKPRKATKPSKAAKLRRMDKKSQRGKTKKLRGKVSHD